MGVQGLFKILNSSLILPANFLWSHFLHPDVKAVLTNSLQNHFALLHANVFGCQLHRETICTVSRMSPPQQLLLSKTTFTLIESISANIKTT